MLSQKIISDRLEIQDLLARYCEAIDSRNFDDLDDLFTADAMIDYTEAGGEKGSLAETKAFLAKALEKFTGMQHMIGLPLIVLDGDKANVKTALYNPMVMSQAGKPHTFFVGMWYIDEMVRTESGWRISKRSEKACYFSGMPEGLVE